MDISLGYKPGSMQNVCITYEYRYIAADIHHSIAMPGKEEHGGGRSKRAASLYTEARRAQNNSARRKKSPCPAHIRSCRPPKPGPRHWQTPRQCPQLWPWRGPGPRQGRAGPCCQQKRWPSRLQRRCQSRQVRLLWRWPELRRWSGRWRWQWRWPARAARGFGVRRMHSCVDLRIAGLWAPRGSQRRGSTKRRCHPSSSNVGRGNPRLKIGDSAQGPRLPATPPRPDPPSPRPPRPTAVALQHASRTCAKAAAAPMLPAAKALAAALAIATPLPAAKALAAALAKAAPLPANSSDAAWVTEGLACLRLVFGQRLPAMRRC